MVPSRPGGKGRGNEKEETAGLGSTFRVQLQFDRPSLTFYSYTIVV